MMALQSLALILAATAVVSADVQWPPKSIGDKMLPVLLDCLKTIPLDEEIIQSARLGNIPDLPQVKKLILCGFDAIGSIDHATGELLHYKLLDLVPDPECQRYAMELGRECLKIHEPRAEDTVYKFVTCMFAAGAKFDFF